MHSKGGSIALSTVGASGPLGGRKLGVLQQQGGTATASELLTLPAIGVTCCSSSCSSSSSPSGADEPAENWASTGGLIESPASARHRACYCCLDPCANRYEASANNRCNSSCNTCCSPICSCRGDFKWWGVEQGGSSSCCCCNLAKDMDCSTVCSTSSRPEERQPSLAYTSTEAVKSSNNSNNGDNCKSNCTNSCKGSSPSRGEYKWRGRMNLFLRRAVLGDFTKSSNGSNNGRCCSAADPHTPESTSQEQRQDRTPRCLLVGAADPNPRTQEAEPKGAPLSGAPLGALGRSWQDARGPKGLRAETRFDSPQEAPDSEIGKAAATNSQQQPLLLLASVKEVRSSTPMTYNTNSHGDCSGIDQLVRQPLQQLPVAYSSSNSPAAAEPASSEATSAVAEPLSPAAAATPTAAVTTPTAAPTTPAAAATPTTAATTPTAAAATPTAAPVTHTEGATETTATSIAGATPIAANAASPAAATTPTTAATPTNATAKILATPSAHTPTEVAATRPSEASFSSPSGGSSSAVCEQSAPSCEPRFCYCLEHLLAGLCWGPPCLCGALQDSVRWGFGGTCTVDNHLVNPQQELELLLQRAAATAPSGGEGPTQVAPQKKIAGDRYGALRAAQRSGEAGLWSPTGDSLLPMPTILSSAGGDSSACTSLGRLVPGNGSALSSGDAVCAPPLPESCSPISDWGSPAQQWAVPQRTECDGTDTSSCSSEVRPWNPTLVKKRGYGMGNFSSEEKEEGRSCLGLFAPLLGFEGPPKGSSQNVSRYPRTALCADAFVCSGVQWLASSEDEAGESGAEGGGGRPLLPLPSCSARFCGGKALETGKPYTRDGRRKRDGGVRDRNKLAEGFRSARDCGNSLLYSSSKRTTGTPFCLRPNAHQPLSSTAGGPVTGQGATWADIREADRTGKFTGGPEGTPGCAGSRWRDGGREETRDAVCSSGNGGHQTVMEIAAVPVRTRKGFRKPLPLPPEMLAAIAAAGPRRPVEPVLQYDGESREWRVFWMEEPQARYKVFQSKKFGKERAQQLALEWLHRAKAGAIHGSGRGPRVGGPSAYRFKRGRHEGPPLATEYKHSSPETLQLSTPHSALELSPEASPALTPFPTAIPAI